MQWAVVGAKGEKRLVKTTARDNSNWARGRGGQRSGPPPRGREDYSQPRGGYNQPRGRGRPPTTSYNNRNSNYPARSMDSENIRTGVRRARSEEEEMDDQPPGKR